MKQRKVPLRKCIVCNEMKEKKELLRIVKNKDNEIFIDETGKANGRGAYVCENKDCLDKLVSKKVLNRIFKMDIPDEIYKSIEEKLK